MSYFNSKDYKESNSASKTISAYNNSNSNQNAPKKDLETVEKNLVTRLTQMKVEQDEWNSKILKELLLLKQSKQAQSFSLIENQYNISLLCCHDDNEFTGLLTLINLIQKNINQAVQTSLGIPEYNTNINYLFYCIMLDNENPVNLKDIARRIREKYQNKFFLVLIENGAKAYNYPEESIILTLQKEAIKFPYFSNEFILEHKKLKDTLSSADNQPPKEKAELLVIPKKKIYLIFKDQIDLEFSFEYLNRVFKENLAEYDILKIEDASKLKEEEMRPSYLFVNIIGRIYDSTLSSFKSLANHLGKRLHVIYMYAPGVTPNVFELCALGENLKYEFIRYRGEKGQGKIESTEFEKLSLFIKNSFQ